MDVRDAIDGVQFAFFLKSFGIMHSDHASPSDVFPPFLLDGVTVWPARNQLCAGDAVMSLEPRVMSVLCVLAEHAEDVVNRDALIERVWDVDGSDDSVTRSISMLRKALAQLGASHDLIETIPKRGYRLARPIALAQEARSNGAEPAAPLRRAERSGVLRRVIAGVALAAVASLSLLYAGEGNLGPEASDPPASSVAVLPFVSISVERSDQLFADGLSEELLNALAGVPGLTVSARSSSFAFKGRSESVETIGEALGVGHVLEGSLRRSGQRVRVTAQLSSVDTGYRLWSETYDRALDDIFDVQEDIARQVAMSLKKRLAPAAGQSLFDAGTDRASAFDSYVRGRDYLNRRGLGLARAITNFENAIDVDPVYARAYAGLATSHAVSHIYLNVPKALARERARNFANEALKFDPTLAEPHAVLGVIEANQNHWAEAIAHYKKAEELEPNDVTVLLWYAEVLSYVGYTEQADEKIQRALEVEPESAVLHLIAGNVALNLNDLERTEKHYRLSETFGLSDGVNGSSFSELAAGNFERAAEMMALAQFNDQRIGKEDVAALEAFFLGIMRHEHGVDGYIDHFRALADDDDFLVPAYMMSGESEKALRLLEADPDGDHDSYYLLWSPLDPNLRRVPYFMVFARNAGLAAFWDQYGWPPRCRPERQPDGDVRHFCR